MHQQLAERFFVQLRQMNGAHRAAVFHQSFGGGAAFRRHQVADCFATESGLARELGKFGIHARPTPCAGDGDNGE